MNCFHFTYLYLKKNGFKIPSEWNGLNYKAEAKKIKLNPSHYVDAKILHAYFKSFTTLETICQKDDIILHDKGVGVALTKGKFMTLNHLGKIIIKPISSQYVIRRVK